MKKCTIEPLIIIKKNQITKAKPDIFFVYLFTFLAL